MRRRRPVYRNKLELPKWSLSAITVIWWVLLAAIMLTTDPEKLKNVIFTGLYFPFLLLVFLAVSGTIYILRKKFWPSFFWAVGISLFLLLRVYGWGNVINLGIIILCLAVWEGYWRWLAHRKKHAIKEVVTVIDREL